MRCRLWRGAAAACAGTLLLSCTDTPLAPKPSPLAPSLSLVSPADQPIRISEIHYDNAGTDANEAIEISGGAGVDLTGWTVVLYNGSNGTAYDTSPLSGPIPATCGARGVVVINYPSNGIQNGSPDGMALVNASGTVLEFLSYEGSFTAAGGPADGMTSTDIGVSESSVDIGLSLQLDGAGVWQSPAPNTFGACNDTPIDVGPVATITVSPSAATLALGETQPFAASAFDADGNPVNSATFAWSSSVPATVAIDASSGVATAQQPGDVTITATSNGVTATASVHVKDATAAAMHIAELHYDNVGADAGEEIEIEGPAGTDLTGWSLLLYNGNGGAAYNTKPLSGAIPATCGTRGVVTVTYPANSGIQNGDPDGVALLDAQGHAVEFLSYEGTFTASGGPAAGMLSRDIGVAESNATTSLGFSLQRDPNGTWFGPAPATFGACNTAAPIPPIVINELMADPQHAAGGASFGEWFEVYNSSTAPIDLKGWTIATAGQPEHVIASSVVVPAGGYAVLGRGADVTKNGGITIDYNYFTGTSSTIFLDATDFLALRNSTGATVDSVRWTDSRTIVKGVTRALRDVSLTNSDVDGANWGYSTVPFGDGDLGSPHAANGTLSNTPPAAPDAISFSGRLPSDPPLPIGFEDQLFATLTDGSGNPVQTTFTWTSETPTLATIDANGVMHALAAGSAVFRATAADGSTATITLPTAQATMSTTAQYGNNTEFGDPTDADASDDFLVHRPEYTTSYNKHRGTPNWVSYDLDASQFGSQVDRCDCFTFDPALPQSFTHLTTADYTGAGAAAGYGIDRGHLARSFDRTAGTLDNATTYYLSNIIPQASDLNQGPWANMENFLGDEARGANKEVYIIAGPAGNKGTVKGEGKIVIPASVWKVAVIMPRDEGLADVHTYLDVQVIAVIMPNDPGVRDVDWHTYETTVDAVEALSGYDLLALLPDKIERIVESNAKPPLAAIDGPYTSTEGAAIAMSGAASMDPNGSIVSYAWTFGDGVTTTGATAAVSHTYTQDGDYAVRLIVTDNDGLADTVNTTAHVANVAPAIGAFDGATLLPGETYTTAGAFTDPGADPWSGSVDYGDGTGAATLTLNGMSFSLTHTYGAAGAFQVTVKIADDDATSARTQTVTVITPLEGVRNASASVEQLVASGTVSAGNGHSLEASLNAASRQIESGQNTPAINQLGAFVHEVDAMVQSGRLPETTANELTTWASRVSRSLSR